MKVGIIDYKAGNVTSVAYTLKRLGVQPVLTHEPGQLEQCDKIIFPGVGHARYAMERLRENRLDEWIKQCRQPLLGICLGMQLLCRHSEEGDTPCIGIFDVPIQRFTLPSLKIPQAGWNTLTETTGPLFRNIPANTYVYFVHSYYAPLNINSIATCSYGIDFSCALQKDNFFAVQFHPEKSGAAGERIVKNFLEM